MIQLQLKAVGIHLWVGGNIADGATAYDTESWISGDIIYAAAFIPWTSDSGGARIVS